MNPPRSRQKRVSVAARFGLPDDSPWTGVPVAFARFCKAADLPAGHVLVLHAIFDLWRPHLTGTVLTASVRDIEELVPLSKSQVQRALDALEGWNLIHRNVRPGQAVQTDLGPLLDALARHAKDGTVPPRARTRQLYFGERPDAVPSTGHSPPPDAVPSTGHGCPASGSGGVPSSSLVASTQSQRTAFRERACDVDEASTRASADAAPHGTENGNGHVPSTPADVVREIRRRLAGRDPRPPMSDAERAEHAARVRAQTAAFPSADDPPNAPNS